MKILVVVQARTASTRLPGKVLRPVAGAPMLVRMLERVRAAGTRFDLVVATTTDSADAAIADLCESAEVDCFRGHPTDLLDRHYQAARARGADVVVKIPSDCPLIDPAVIDSVIDFYLQHHARYDFVSNLHPATYPDGNDVEVMAFGALETAWREAELAYEREHTTPFLWDRPERFRVGNVVWDTGLDLSMSHRFTVDYVEDYAFVAAIYAALWSESRPVFSLDDIFAFLEDRPDVLALNAFHAGVNWYRHHLGALRTIRRHETRQVVA